MLERKSDGVIRRILEENAGFVKDISDIIAIEAWKDPSLVPDLSREEALFIFSDYSHNRGQYRTYSFLVLGRSQADFFNLARKELRASLGVRDRRISFKGLNDRVKMRALPGFLSIAGILQGFVLTFAVSSSIPYMFAQEFLQFWPELGVFKKAVLEEMLRIAHFGAQAILIGFNSGQNIYCFTDEDSIVSNEMHQRQFGKLSEAIIRKTLHGEEIGKIAFGLSNIDDGSLELEDYLAIPDLVAGAICETLDTLREGGYVITPRIAFERPGVSGKADLICDWIGETRNPLKQFGVAFERIGKGPWDWRPTFFRIRSEH